MNIDAFRTKHGGTCRDARCGRPIFFVRNATTGKSSPLDWDPAPEGNCHLVEQPQGQPDAGELRYVVGGVKPQGVARFTNHFGTCKAREAFGGRAAARSGERD